LNVLIVSHLWPRADFPHLGIFVADQAAELARHCSISVVAPVDLTHRSEEIGLKELLIGRPKYRARSQPEFVPARQIKPRILTFRAAPLRHALALATAKSLAHALETVGLNSVDLVHAHTLFPDGLACSLWLKDKNVPLVITAHGSDVHSMPPGVQKSLPQILERADHLIAVSHALAVRLIALGADPQMISVLPNGFAPELFDLNPWPARDPNRIVFLGRLGAVKRVELLIQALGHLPNDVRLEIAGDGVERDRLARLAESMRLTPRVRILGALARADVPPFLAGAALMCLVSQKEGWPTVIFESLACGTPVLATAVGGVPEALEDPKLGTLIPADISPEALAAQIRAALAGSWDHAAIRQHALNYSWPAITSNIHELYQKLIIAQNTTSWGIA
jgi:glycosyltransferase involved in cell wall biosynthesis